MKILKLILKLNTRKQKGLFLLFVFLMIIGAVMETAGISLMLPLVSLILDTETIMRNQYVMKLCSFFRLQNDIDFIIFMLITLAFVFVIKNIYLVVVRYFELKFINGSQRELAVRILEAYMRKPYEYYLNSSTGMIMRVLGSDVGNVFIAENALMQLIAEAIVLVFIVTFLLIVDTNMTLVMVGLLGSLLALIFFFFKPKCYKEGKTRLACMSGMNKCQIQAFSSIKEIMVMQKKQYFIDSYNEMGKVLTKSSVKNDMYSNIPRYLIEAVSIAGIMAYLVIAIKFGTPIEAMITTVTAFAVAAVRLLPSANRISSCLNICSANTPAIQSVISCLENETLVYERIEEKRQAERVEMKKNIEMNDIVFAYPGSNKLIFDHANLQILSGQSVGIIGESGAGKSTVVDILLGLLKLNSGEITVDGRNIFDNYSGWLSNIGYIPQTINLLDGSIRDNVAFGISQSEINETRIWEVLKEAQLDKYVRELPEGLDSQIGERGVRISGGQRQRLGIARALYSNPGILIFDEATSALDNEMEAAIMEAVNSFHGKKTMIIIAHRLATIQECDVVYKVENAKIVKRD